MAAELILEAAKRITATGDVTPKVSRLTAGATDLVAMAKDLIATVSQLTAGTDAFFPITPLQDPPLNPPSHDAPVG